MFDSYRQIDQAIERSERIVLIGHRRPDEDALGATLSFYLYLKSLGKQVWVFLADLPPSYLYFLPAIDEVTSDPAVFGDFVDLYVFLDCASLAQARLPAPESAADGGQARLPEGALKHKNILNIDHHFSNNHYGSINLVDAKASSTCEIIYKYFVYRGKDIDKQLATCLLTGILGDTSGFVHSNTNSETVHIASELVKRGVKINQLFNFVIRNKTIGGLRLWGEILSRIQINKELSIAYTYIKEDDFRSHHVAEDELDGLANFLNVIVDAKATAVFHLWHDKTKASWRTKRDDLDLSAFCQIFGGGGHKKAAGFTLDWPVVEKDGRLVV